MPSTSCPYLNVQSRVTAKDIAEEFNLSPTTVYRRVNQLLTHGLVEEDTRIGEDGNQYSVYHAQFLNVSIEIANGLTYAVIVTEDSHDFYRILEFPHLDNSPAHEFTDDSSTHD